MTGWFADIQLDDAEIFDMLNSADGPVGQLIIELSAQAAAVATTAVHVRPGTPRSTVWGPRSTALPPGYTKARIRPHLAWGAQTGRIYGGVNAPYPISTWLETPAEQMYREYPFLTTGLWSLEGTL
jgi:hypothetical protein